MTTFRPPMSPTTDLRMMPHVAHTRQAFSAPVPTPSRTERQPWIKANPTIHFGSEPTRLETAAKLMFGRGLPTVPPPTGNKINFFA